jgi:fluoroacetyl-CoA thioesterase
MPGDKGTPMVTPHPVLAVGLTHTATLHVTPAHTVPKLEPNWDGFADMPPVFATAMMIGFIEQTCIEGLRPYVTAEQRTVGTHVNVSHVAPTVIGSVVTVTVELTQIDGRILTFAVRCRDDNGLIGEGTHQRAVVDYARFMQRIGVTTDS